MTYIIAITDSYDLGHLGEAVVFLFHQPAQEPLHVWVLAPQGGVEAMVPTLEAVGRPGEARQRPVVLGPPITAPPFVSYPQKKSGGGGRKTPSTGTVRNPSKKYLKQLPNGLVLLAPRITFHLNNKLTELV